MKIKLAEALLRRKELNEKVDQLKKINIEGLFEVKATRRNVTENVDDVVVKVPKITLPQVAAGFDWYAKQLRLVDAAIQQANWTTEIDVAPDVMKDYVESVKEKE
jgi:hypothetical protein